MEKIEQLKEFISLKNLFNVPNISYVNVYDDPGVFYDYIAKDDNYFYNFCEITDFNKARYEHLAELNNKIVSKHYIPSTVIIKDNWYFEQIKIFPVNYFKTPVDIKLLLSSVEQLNEDIQACIVDSKLIDGHSHFIKTRFRNTANLFGRESTQANFMDMEKTFELSRMIFEDGIMRFTGVQAIHLGTAEYGIINAVLFSTYLDNDNEILEKFKLIDYTGSLVERIISDVKDKAETDKHTYVMDSDALARHFDKLGKLWKQSQLQVEADL